MVRSDHRSSYPSKKERAGLPVLPSEPHREKFVFQSASAKDELSDILNHKVDSARRRHVSRHH